MRHEEKIRFVIAETSPVISAGFSMCLRRLPKTQSDIVEVKTSDDLLAYVSSNSVDVILVNPTFGGIFNPSIIRQLPGLENCKIMAIEIGKLNSQACALYDGTISVIDDMETIESKVKAICGDSPSPTDDKECLSQREKEIISLVVKGMTNQEIADKLFLSIHTVITHRRNIARKLEIHSATGLTIYAIVNKIVDLSEIKI
ncbi:MAG: response regulator transcription factor [Muribaculaceae bacterium]